MLFATNSAPNKILQSSIESSARGSCGDRAHEWLVRITHVSVHHVKMALVDGQSIGSQTVPPEWCSHGET